MGKYKHKTKAQRRAWWNSLTDEQRQQHIERWTAQRGERNAGRPSNCPVYGPWDETNKHIWRAKILKHNDWLPRVNIQVDTILVNVHNQAHLDSIKEELRQAI